MRWLVLWVMGAATSSSALAVDGTFVSEAGWTVQLPAAWVVERDDEILGARAVTGERMVVLPFEPGGAVFAEQVRVDGSLLVEPIRFQLRGPAPDEHALRGAGATTREVRWELDGVDPDGVALFATLRVLLHRRGALTVVAWGPAEREAAWQQEVDDVMRTVTFTRPPATWVGEDQRALSGAFCAASCGLADASFRLQFDGRGGFISEPQERGWLAPPPPGGTVVFSGPGMVLSYRDGFSLRCEIERRRRHGSVAAFRCGGLAYRPCP